MEVVMTNTTISVSKKDRDRFKNICQKQKLKSWEVFNKLMDLYESELNANDPLNKLESA